MVSPVAGTEARPSEEALEAELRCLVGESGAKAAALCLLDPRVGGLRLVADVGLSDGACQHLHALGRPDGAKWSLPLESLIAREPRTGTTAAYASPVPPLLDPLAAPATVLCLPLIADDAMLGSVILVAHAQVALGAADAAALDAGLGRLARVAERLLRGIPDAARPSLLDRLASQALDAVVPLLDEAARLLEATASLGWERRRLRAETREQTSMLEAVRGERDRLLAERAAAAATHAAERARLAARFDEAEAAWSRSVRLAEEQVRLEMQAQLDAHVARGAVDREETLRQARQLVQRSEQQRAAAAAEAAEASGALAEARAHSMALQGDLTRLDERTRRLEAAVAAAVADRTRLEHSLAEWRETAVDACEEAAQAHAEAEERQADVQRREAALALAMADVERASAARVAELSASMGELAQQRDRVVAERDAARTQTRRLQDEHEAFKARAVTDREETLCAALAANAATEEARAAAVAELDVVHDALGKSQGVILELEEDQARGAELESARRAIAESEAARLEAEDRVRALQADMVRLSEVERDLERMATEAAAAHAAAVDATRRAEARGGELLRAEAAVERAEALARTEAEVASSANARLREIEALLGEKRVEVTDLRATLRDVNATLDAARARERQRAEELRAAECVAADHEDTLRRALALSQASDEARAAAFDETEALRGALATAQSRLLAAEDEARNVHDAVERLQLGARQAVEDRERLIVAADEATDRVAALGARVAELEAALAAEQATRNTNPSRRPTVAARSESAPAAPRPPSGAEILIVLDGTAVWEAQSGDASRLVSVSPSDGDVAQLESAAGVVVNLAAPGALDAVAATRRAGHTVRLWGYVTHGATGPALAMGAIDVLESSAEPAQALDTLRPHLAARRRVLAVGGDGPRLLALRQALKRLAGTSVSIGWDVKQASDLLEIVRPEIVVVDLALRGAHGLVAEAAACPSAPLLVLIPTGHGDEAAFGKMAVPLLTGPRAVPRDVIIARALADIQRETASKVGLLERARDLR